MVDHVVVAAESVGRDIDSVPIAAALARQLGVPLTVLSVVGSSDQVEGRRATIVESLAELGLGEAEVDVRASEDVGACLIGALARRSSALACLTSHARRSAGNVILGSVVDEVVRETRLPVAVFGPRVSRDWSGRAETILVPLDGSEVSASILPVAADLAKSFSAGLRIVSVPESGGEKASAELSRELEHVADGLRRQHGVEARLDVIGGDGPAEAICAAAREAPGTLIAMSTHGRSGLSRIVMGSVSQRVVRGAGCPVIVQRPR